MTMILEECEIILGRGDGDGSHEAEIRRKAGSRIAVLAGLARVTCEVAVGGGDGNPVRAMQLAAGLSALMSGVDNVHRLLRQAVPESDEVMKNLASVKKGPCRNLRNDIENQLDYTEPVSWAFVPSLRAVVQVLKELESMASA